MKKRQTALAIIVSAAMLLSGITVFADTNSDKVLTLEEAKQIALDNDTQYKQQQSYIDQAAENYDDVYDIYSGKDKANYKSIALKSKEYVSRKMTIEKAAFAVEQAIFKKDNIKKTSDYNVTSAYYDAASKKLALDDAKTDMDLSEKQYNVAKVKFDQGLITKNVLTQTENAYKTTQTAYNKAFADMQNSMQTLGNEIGETLDVFNVELDTTFTVPDISTLNLNRIKSDYMNYSETLFGLRGQLELMDTQLDLTQEQYDHYFDKVKHMSEEVENDFNELLTNAKRDYDDAKYALEEAEKSLDSNLSSLYSGINNLKESLENLKKNVESAKVTLDENKLKYDLGLISALEMDNSEATTRTLENQLNSVVLSINSQYLALIRYSTYDDTISSNK